MQHGDVLPADITLGMEVRMGHENELVRAICSVGAASAGE